MFHITADGEDLRPWNNVGVAQPARIRLLNVPAVPAPADPELRQPAIEQNLIGAGTAGLTLGYSIFVVDGCLTPDC